MKRNFIKLVKEMKDDKPVYDTYITPVFIPLKKMYEAIDVMEELENNENLKEKQGFDMMFDMVVDIYENQFTKEQLIMGLHAPEAVEELRNQIIFIAQGQMNEERKKELAKMI